MSIISFSELGKMGRLGNQLFQIASTIGIAAKNNMHASFPLWKYNDFFDAVICPVGKWEIQIKERNFHYDDYEIYNSCDIKGYLQSEKYFKHIEKEIRNQFRFEKHFSLNCYLNMRVPKNGKKNIAVHVRRTDYVNNPSHYNLSMRYYLNALDSIPNWQDFNLLFFSDEIPFCEWHFDCLPNAYFMKGGSDIEDLCTMSLCDHFIIANSSFSWWAAWLCDNPNKIVIRPAEHFAGNQLKHNIKDLYPESWKVVSDKVNVELNDVTFVIPVHHDHNDRAANLNLVAYHLHKNFSTKLIVGEQGSRKFNYTKDFARYIYFEADNFHRTWMINEMAKEAETPFVVNYDADILINPVQIWYSVQLLRKGVEIVYPYDGNFKHVARPEHGNLAENLYWLIGTNHKGPIGSFGGAVFMNKESFFKAGGENEKFIAFGPEDAERFHRFLKLGLSLIRVKGPIYHLDHYRGINSSKTNPYIHENRAEWHRVRNMDKETLTKYIESWQNVNQ